MKRACALCKGHNNRFCSEIVYFIAPYRIVFIQSNDVLEYYCCCCVSLSIYCYPLLLFALSPTLFPSLLVFLFTILYIFSILSRLPSSSNLSRPPALFHGLFIILPLLFALQLIEYLYSMPFCLSIRFSDSASNNEMIYRIKHEKLLV